MCLYELGNRISNVAVEKGYEMSAHPKQGFMRTIDITLTTNQAEKLNIDGWDVLVDNLKAKLKSRSGMSNHYRIFLSK